MKYQTLLTNIKRGLNVMYFITKESDKSVISDTVYEPSKCGSFRTLLHNVTIDTDLTKGVEIRIEIIDEKDPIIRFYKTVLNDDNVAIRYQYLFGVCTYKKCIAEIIAEIYQTMNIIVNQYKLSYRLHGEKEVIMKTLYDYFKCICEGDYSSPLYTMPNSIYGFARLTTLGHMIYISYDMLYGGEY